MPNSFRASLDRNMTHQTPQTSTPAVSQGTISIAHIWTMARDWAWTQVTAHQRAAAAAEARRVARLIAANEPSFWSPAAIAANSQLDHAVLEARRKLWQQLEVDPIAQTAKPHAYQPQPAAPQKRVVGQ